MGNQNFPDTGTNYVTHECQRVLCVLVLWVQAGHRIFWTILPNSEKFLTHYEFSVGECNFYFRQWILRLESF